jgi:hypothetical protein
MITDHLEYIIRLQIPRFMFVYVCLFGFVFRDGQWEGRLLGVIRWYLYLCLCHSRKRPNEMITAT